MNKPRVTELWLDLKVYVSYSAYTGYKIHHWPCYITYMHLKIYFRIKWVFYWNVIETYCNIYNTIWWNRKHTFVVLLQHPMWFNLQIKFFCDNMTFRYISQPSNNHRRTFNNWLFHISKWRNLNLSSENIVFAVFRFYLFYVSHG